MTHDTHDERPSSQDELLAHIIPMRHRAADQTQLHDEQHTNEHTSPGEHTLWDPSSDPPLPRRRNTPAASTANTTPPPDTAPPAHRASPRALRGALAGLTAAAAVALALHSQAGATPHPPALVSNTPAGSETIAVEHPTRPNPSPKTTDAPQHHLTPIRPRRPTPVTPPATVTIDAHTPTSAAAQPHNNGAAQEFALERYPP